MHSASQTLLSKLSQAKQAQVPEGVITSTVVLCFCLLASLSYLLGVVVVINLP